MCFDDKKRVLNLLCNLNGGIDFLTSNENLILSSPSQKIFSNETRLSVWECFRRGGKAYLRRCPLGTIYVGKITNSVSGHVCCRKPYVLNKDYVKSLWNDILETKQVDGRLSGLIIVKSIQKNS